MDRLIEPGQVNQAREQKVDGELGLIDHPADPVAGHLLSQERIDQTAITAKDLGPFEVGETVVPGSSLTSSSSCVKALCFCTKHSPKRTSCWASQSCPLT